MIAKKDRLICKDPLNNAVWFDSSSLGLAVLVPELSGDVAARIRTAIEKLFIIESQKKHNFGL